MAKRNVFYFLMVALVSLVLAACGSGSSDEPATDSGDSGDSGDAEVTTGGEIRVAYSAQPPSLDPHVSTAIITAEVMGHVFEPLLTTDANYNVKPSLAESYEQSEDGLTITFNLREGVLFHNGKEMKAEDVVASMNRWKDGPGGRGQFGNAEFVEVDEYTVDLVMEEPISTALVAMSQGTSSFAAIYPKEEVENADETSIQNFIG